MTKTPTKVFLSYSAQDRLWVSQFAQALRHAGVEGWFDEDELEPGDRVHERTLEALRESRVLVVLLSDHNLENSNTFFEVGAAIADKKKIIPVLIGEGDPLRIPGLLRQFQFVRGESPDEAGRQVAEVVESTFD